MKNLKLYVFFILLVVLPLWVLPVWAQQSTPAPSPTAETTEVVPPADGTVVITVTTEPVISNSVQSFLAVLSGMLIDVIVPILAALAIMLLYRGVQWVRSMMSTEQEAVVSALVRMVVQAAEQTGLIGEIVNTGESKKQFALETLQEALRTRGLGTLADSVPELEARIESAINQQIQIPYPAPQEPIPEPIPTPTPAPPVPPPQE